MISYQPMTVTQLLCLLGAGAAAAGGQFSITAAYSCAPPMEISIYDYSQLIFSTTLGFWLFGDVPDVWSCLGYAIIISMALANFIYNNKRHAK
ncbi:MAG: EamA family transporter, partial [Eubacterium sp.]|nr:EamA family transporter [Eubacterium sp.]